MTACMECAANNGSHSLRIADNAAKIFIGILADLMMISNNACCMKTRNKGMASVRSRS